MAPVIRFLAVPIGLAGLGLALLIRFLGAGEPFIAVCAGIGGPLVLIVPGWLAREGWRRRLDKQALEAMLNGRAPKPGAWVAVTGVAQPVGKAMEAPITHRPALFCKYRVYDRPYTEAGNDPVNSTGPSDVRRPRYEGYRLVPTRIETANGNILLRAVPELMDTMDSPAGSAKGIEANAVPIARHWWLRRVVKAQLFSQESDQLSIDWKYPTPGPAGHGFRHQEWALNPGTQLCVMGIWDPAGALLGCWRRPAGIPIYTGDPRQVMQDMGAESWLHLSGSALLLAIGTWAEIAFIV